MNCCDPSLKIKVSYQSKHSLGTKNGNTQQAKTDSTAQESRIWLVHCVLAYAPEALDVCCLCDLRKVPEYFLNLVFLSVKQTAPSSLCSIISQEMIPGVKL